MQYGVRRLLVDKDREPRFQLGPGERKGLSTDRVVVVPGPENEISVVRRIYRMFVDQKRSMRCISRTLNREGIPSSNGRAWNHRRVRTVLTSELMIGYYVYNRRSYPMSGRPKSNPPEQWIKTRIMDPIVEVRKYDKAQLELGGGKRGYGYAKPQLVRSLRRLLEEKKKLSLAIINACSYTPCSGTYVHHFGSLQAAYAAVGYKQSWADRKPYSHYTDEELIDGICRLHNEFGYVTSSHINADPELPKYHLFVQRFGSMAAAYTLAGFPATTAELISAGRKRAALRLLNAEQQASRPSR